MNEHEQRLRSLVSGLEISDVPQSNTAAIRWALGEIDRLRANRIEVYQYDWIPGWAAFQRGSAIRGPAHVALNLGSLLCAVELGDLPKSDMPYVIAESIMHEVMHALEEWAGVEANEERIEKLLEQYRLYVFSTREAAEAAEENPSISDTMENLEHDPFHQ